jgi:hypothetical protein
MLLLNIQISNPFSKRQFETLWCESSVVSQNKVVELQVTRYRYLFGIELEFSARCDHAGARFAIALFGYEFDVHLYDTRHWNEETSQWEVYKF